MRAMLSNKKLPERVCGRNSEIRSFTTRLPPILDGELHCARSQRPLQCWRVGDCTTPFGEPHLKTCQRPQRKSNSASDKRGRRWSGGTRVRRIMRTSIATIAALVLGLAAAPAHAAPDYDQMKHEICAELRAGVPPMQVAAKLAQLDPEIAGQLWDHSRSELCPEFYRDLGV